MKEVKSPKWKECTTEVNSERPVFNEMRKNNYSEILQRCKISKGTAGLIACVMDLHDVLTHVREALTEVYGGVQADNIIGNRMNKKYYKLEAVLLNFVVDSIDDSILEDDYRKMTEI